MMLTRPRARGVVLLVSLGLLVTGTGSAAGASAGQAADEVVTGAKQVGHGVEHTAPSGSASRPSAG
jgi:hypothetical protein